MRLRFASLVGGRGHGECERPSHLLHSGEELVEKRNHGIIDFYREPGLSGIGPCVGVAQGLRREGITGCIFTDGISRCDTI